MAQIGATRCKRTCAADVVPTTRRAPLRTASSLKPRFAWHIVDTTRQATCCKPLYSLSCGACTRSGCCTGSLGPASCRARSN
ncbi:hypothetical protein, partial [Xanthomonas oryzae]|uniref:hypothetical protein n=1 Tax=Xanthomonas oryzae TaxID=347 RepID=UPI003CF34F47